MKADSISVKHGATLSFCASFDPGPGDAQWRIIQITGLDKYGFPAPGCTVMQPPSSYVNLTATTETWNREEVGYGWPVVATFTVPNNGTWPVGLYAVQVGAGQTVPDWYDPTAVANAFFIVRPTSPTSGTKILFCYPWSTTVAYAGGDPAKFKNLYNSPDPQRSRVVALERPWDSFPYEDSPYVPPNTPPQNAWGSPRKPYHTLYLPFVLAQYFEANGYPGAVDYCTSFDLHNDPTILSGYQLFVSVGHDEYWSKEMRNHVEQFVSGGGNAAFFSANTCWWQVRFENSGTQMVCYKTAIEDPLTTTSPSFVTTNWANTPPTRPENSLTGVSYRRGSAAPPKTAVYLTATYPDPFLAGPNISALNDPIGDATNQIFYTETDALNYTGTLGAFTPTGYDGAPLNFTILAYADLTAGSQSGYATMGYFTDGGTIFTAATTDWAAGLGNGAVSQITDNVLSLLTVPRTGAAASYLSRASVPNSWSVLDSTTVSDGVAIVGVNNAKPGVPATGQLVIARTTGPLQWRDPEAYALTSWQNYSAAPPSNTRAMASDILAKNIIAFGNLTSFLSQRDPNQTNSAVPWTSFQSPALLLPAATCGIAATTDHFAFTLVSGNFGDMHYHPSLAYNANAWVNLGRTPYQPRSLTVLDSKLFMTTGDGKLMVRDTSRIDLVWAQISTASSGIFSLAAYYGRLFALDSSTGTTRLLWRAAVPDNAFREPSQIFYTKFSGNMTIGSLTQSGDFKSTATVNAGTGWTHVVRANNGIIFFYNKSTGAGSVRRYTASGTQTVLHNYPSGSFGAWTHVVYVPPSLSRSGSTGEHIIFYDSTSGVAITGHFNTTSGLFVAEQTYGTFSTGWSQVVCTAFGELFFYNATSGTWATGSLDNAGNFYTDASGSSIPTGYNRSAQVGQTRVILYATSSGAYRVYDCFTSASYLFPGTFGTNELHAPSSNGALLRIGSTGSALAGGVTSATWENLRNYALAGTFGTSFDTITDVGVLPP